MILTVLALLAGHRSTLFELSPDDAPTTFALAPAHAALFHPGEATSLNQLGEYGFRFAKVSRWATDVQRTVRDAAIRRSIKGKGREGDSSDLGGEFVGALCAAVQGVLREWEDLLVQTETRILRRDPAFVGEGSFVPLSTLVATFQPWSAVLASLSALVDTLSDAPAPFASWPPGLLMDLLQTLANKGYAQIAALYARLLAPVKSIWLEHLRLFLVHGRPSALAAAVGPDPSAPTRQLYDLRDGAFPTSLSAAILEDIRYTGRAVAVLHEEGRELPRDLKDDMQKLLALDAADGWDQLGRGVAAVRREVGEWMWRNVLQPQEVRDALESLADIHLLRDGLLASSFVHQLADLQHAKLLRSYEPLAIREQDIKLALLRASVGTPLADSEWVDKVRFEMPQGPLRTFLPPTPSRRTATAAGADDPRPTLSLFETHLLGTPLRLTVPLAFPLSLFLPPASQQQYTVINTYLLALRKTQARMRVCWLSLSGGQRSRRIWTKTGEGGQGDEARERKILGREAWGILRSAGWWLDVVESHFMADIIEVQHQALLDKLQATSASPAAPSPAASQPTFSHRASSPAPAASLPGSPTHARFASRPVSAASLRPPERPATPSSVAGSSTTFRRSRPDGALTIASPDYLDFQTLLGFHTVYLGHITSGLLLDHPPLYTLVKAILDACEGFCSTVDRWGGDVVPDLLVEGWGGEGVGEEVQKRRAVVREIQEDLNDKMMQFFSLLTPSASGTSSGTAFFASAFGANLSLNASVNASLLGKPPRAKSAAAGGKAGAAAQADKELDADVSARRHFEMLALRLDWGGWFTAQSQAAEARLDEEDDDDDDA